MTHPDIILDCKKGKENGYARFYNDCVPYVYTIVKRYVFENSYHKDLVQEIFAKVFLNIKTFDANKGTIKFWIRKIAVNECLQYLRKARPLFVAEGLEDKLELVDDSPLPTDLSRKDIEKILADMPRGYKVVFMLSVIDGFDHSEIAEQLNITKETSRSQLNRSKKWIKRFLLSQYKGNLYGLL